MEKPSCTPREPLSKLDDNGTASILNYNLPQSTTYEVVSYIRLDIPGSLFKATEKKPPPGNYWERLDAEREKLDLTPQTIERVLTGKTYTSVSEIMNTGLNFTAQEIPTSSGVRFQAAMPPAAPLPMTMTGCSTACRMTCTQHPLVPGMILPVGHSSAFRLRLAHRYQAASDR